MSEVMGLEVWRRLLPSLIGFFRLWFPVFINENYNSSLVVRLPPLQTQRTPAGTPFDTFIHRR